MYDKCSVLRTGTTINDPHEFKVFGTVRHRDDTESRQWKTMGKSISNLYRYAEVSKACNQRFINAMVDIVPVRSVQQEIGAICSGKTVKGRRVPGFNVWSPDVLRVMGVLIELYHKDYPNLIAKAA